MFASSSGPMPTHTEARSPYGAVYATPVRSEDAGSRMRHLPEQPVTPDHPAPAETTSEFAPAGIDLPLADKATLHHVFARVKPDLTARFLSFIISSPDSLFTVIATTYLCGFPE